MHQTIHQRTLLGAMRRPGELYEVVAAQGQSRSVAVDLHRAERSRRVGTGALAPSARAERRGHADAWRRDALTKADPDVTLHLHAEAFDVARPGEDGTPQSISPRFFNLCLRLIGAGALLVIAGRMVGLV